MTQDGATLPRARMLSMLFYERRVPLSKGNSPLTNNCLSAGVLSDP